MRDKNVISQWTATMHNDCTHRDNHPLNISAFALAVECGVVGSDDCGMVEVEGPPAKDYTQYLSFSINRCCCLVADLTFC